jgi:hypothetical protein
MSSLQSISITSAQSYASVATQQSLQPFANLDLSEAQRTSLRSIFTNAKKTGESQADVQKQVDALLTTAQQKTLAADIKAGPNPGSSSPSAAPHTGSPFANLNLSSTQSASIASILASAKQSGASRADVQKQIDAVLTTAQQQTLASDIQAHQPPPNAAAAGASASADSASDAASSDAASTSSSSSVDAAVTNVQNQAAAAQAARINTLLQQVLGSVGSSTLS